MIIPESLFRFKEGQREVFFLKYSGGNAGYYGILTPVLVIYFW